MNNQLAAKLVHTKNWQLWLLSVLVAVLLTLPIVAVMNYLLTGEVTRDYLLTGLVASVIVSLCINGFSLYFLQAMRSLQEENIHLHAIIDACPVPIAVLDQNLNIIALNTAFVTHTGYSLATIPTLLDLLSKGFPNLSYRIAIKDNLLRDIQDMPTAAPAKPLAVSISCSDSRLKSAMLSSHPLVNTTLGSHLLLLNMCDNTADTINALVEAHTILESIIEKLPVRVFWKDVDSRYLGCNSAFARDGGGQTPLDIIGKTDAELTWSEQAERYRRDDQDVILTGLAKLGFEEPQSTAAGDSLWLRTSKVPLFDSLGQTIGVLGIYEDITTEKLLQQELWLTKIILDNCQTSFYRISATGKVLYVNNYACSALGYAREELLGSSPWDFDPDFSASDWPALWEKLRQEKQIKLETRHLRKDGTLIDIEVTGHYIVYDGEEFSFTFTQDISERRQIERILRQKERYQRALLDNFPFMVWLKDTQSRFLAVNEVLAHALGESSPDNLIGKTDFDYSPPKLAEHYQQDDQLVMQSRQRRTTEEEHIDNSGNQRWIETFKAPVIDENGELLGSVGFARDISQRRSLEADLRVSAAAFESQEGMVITDADTQILKTNQAFTIITGYSAQEAMGQKISLLKSGVHDASFYAEMWGCIKQHGSWQGEIWNRRKTGELYPQWLTITAVQDATGEVRNYVGALIDITTRKAIEEQIYHLAHFDALTNLPNRTLLDDRLQQSLAKAKREKRKLAVMYLDLDKFKAVNDAFGHDIGDQLLQEAARRLQVSVKRETDTVCRLGGDEFLILLSSVDVPEDANIVAEEILQSLSQTYLLKEHRLSISASIGIAIYPLHGNNANALVQNADFALYQAKHHGRNCFRYYAGEVK